MYKRSALPAWILSCALAGALALVPLVSCSSSEGTDEGTTETTEEAVETAEETEEVEEEEPIWVMTASTSHTESSASGDSEWSVTYELDEAGNVIKMQTGEGGETTYTTTEDGYYEEVTSGDDTMVYEVERDDQGRIIKGSYDEGVEEYSYNDEGFVTKVSAEYVTHSYDEEGNPIEGTEGKMIAIYEYDDEGYLTRASTDFGDGPRVLTYTYEYDDEGRAASRTSVSQAYDTDGNEVGEPTEGAKSTFEYDENGNIAKTTDETEYATSVTEYTYTKVEHPSMWARVKAHFKNA